MGWLERRCGCPAGTEACHCPASRVRWRGGYRVGPDKIQATFGTKGQARAFVAAGEAAAGRGDHVDPRGGDVLFGEWAGEWLTGRGVLAKSTQAGDRSRLKVHVLPEFQTVPLRAITPTRVRQWVSDLADDLSPKTVRHCHAQLHSILDLAVAERLISRNPCGGTRLPELVRDEPVFLTPQEVSRLVGAMPEHWQPLVILLAGTGLRWAEAVGLRARWLDVLGRELSVRWTWSNAHGWKPTPKTRSSRRTIGLPLDVAEAVAPLVVDRSAEYPVFTSPRGAMVHHSNFMRSWRAAVAEAGITSGPTPHDLRHTHASRLLEAGAPMLAVSRRLGHSSISTTVDLYGHLSRTGEADVIALLDRAIQDPLLLSPLRPHEGRNPQESAV